MHFISPSSTNITIKELFQLFILTFIKGFVYATIVSLGVAEFHELKFICETLVSKDAVWTVRMERLLPASVRKRLTCDEQGQRGEQRKGLEEGRRGRSSFVQLGFVLFLIKMTRFARHFAATSVFSLILTSSTAGGGSPIDTSKPLRIFLVKAMSTCCAIASANVIKYPASDYGERSVGERNRSE